MVKGNAKDVIGNLNVSNQVSTTRVVEKLVEVSVSGVYAVGRYEAKTLVATSSPSNNVLRLPNATLIEPGWDIEIVCASSSSENLDIELFDQNVLIILEPGDRFRFQLLTNSDTAGSWFTIFQPAAASVGNDTVLPCDVSVAVNDIVYIDVNGVCQKASAASASTADAIGWVESKPTSGSCRIAQFGRLSQFTGLLTGKPIFLSLTPGLWTQVPPNGTDGIALKRVGMAASSSSIVVDLSKPILLRGQSA